MQLIMKNDFNSDRVAIWYAKSTVKNGPRRFLDQDKAQHFFPSARQALVIHPLVSDRGDEAIHFVLTQTAYRYLNEIASIETDCVNQVALSIANGELFPVDLTTRQQALSIIIDEAYHAYVALDAIQQIEAQSQIKMLPFQSENPISKAILEIPSLFSNLSSENQKYFQFVAVCLSEHVLTKDLVLIKEDLNCEFFNQIMTDHLIDEGMHAHFFGTLLTHFFENLEQTLRSQLEIFIPYFMQVYLNLETQKEFNTVLLNEIGLRKEEIVEVLEDTYYGQTLAANPATHTFISVLKRSKILTEGSLLFSNLLARNLIA